MPNTMISENDWETITRVFRKALVGSYHYAIASVNEDGSPHVTPIGSLFLREDKTGFYFEKFPKKLPHNLKYNQNVCILAVNSKLLFWLRTLLRGEFFTPPGIRLIGTMGERRRATEEEVKLFLNRLKSLLPLFSGLVTKSKGYKLLWGDLKYVREIQFTSFETIEFGSMTSGLRTNDRR